MSTEPHDGYVLLWGWVADPKLPEKDESHPWRAGQRGKLSPDSTVALLPRLWLSSLNQGYLRWQLGSVIWDELRPGCG